LSLSLRVDFSEKDRAKLRKNLERVARVVKRHASRRLHLHCNTIIKNIRNDHTLFKYKDAEVDYNRGKLKESLWTEKADTSTKAVAVQQIGWAVPYGDVLEWGPVLKKTWEIKPKGFRSDVGGKKWRSGGQQALQFLRFKYKGSIVYSRGVTHKWTEAEKRPHVTPHVEQMEAIILEDLESIPSKVFSGELN
jgi:hypothetical protein